MKESVLNFEEQITQPTFKMPTSTKSSLRLTRKILFLTISVYEY